MLSSPGGFILIGGLTHSFGGIALNQRVPLRNYLGVKLTSVPKVTCDLYGSYDIQRDEFVQSAIDADILSYANIFLDKMHQVGYKGGIHFGLYNEIPARHGLNSPGVGAANFCVGYLLSSGRISPEDLIDYSKTSYKSQNPDVQRTISENAMQFHAAGKTYNASGFGCIVSLINSKMPIAYQSGKAIPLHHLFEYSSNEEYPVDMVVVGTADRGNLDFPLYEVTGIIERGFKFEGIDILGQSGFIPLDSTISDPSAYLLARYKDTNYASGLFALVAAGIAFRDRDSDSIKRFLFAMDNSHQSFNLLADIFSRKRTVTDAVKHYLNGHAAGIPYAIVTSIANHIVVLSIRETLREQLPQIKDYLHSELEFTVTFPYISWIDGTEEYGTRIEQFLGKDIYSLAYPKGSQYVLTLNANSTVVKVHEFRSKDDLYANTDLLFDSDTGKVYIQGEKLNSSILPSSVTTIEVFSALLKSDKLVVSNSILSQSSYSAARNELQSKVLTPLKNIIKDKLGKDIIIKIRGAGADYEVQLYSSDISISLLTRI